MDRVVVGVIGLGYVGLPLARLFATKYRVVGFDINRNRVEALSAGFDCTGEVSEEALRLVLHKHAGGTGEPGLFLTSDVEALRPCNYFIITVPTPVDKHNRPDLSILVKASETVGRVVSAGDIVIYESTVYPGATEEDCIPVVERVSGLICNRDFFAGYSPERINPGDKEHTVEKIKKVTSGSTPETAVKVDALYGSVITGGTHPAPSIKVAEAAKVIENAQRDINIAFVNELSKIFHRMGIDTQAVLEAAGSKWNFMPFKPGLVGGHCIGVDPYYLAQKAQEYGYHPEIILAGRRLNDSMGGYVATETVKLITRRGRALPGARVLILGFTFKENCNDIRNTKVIDIYRELCEFGLCTEVFDPMADPAEVEHHYGVALLRELPPLAHYAAVILAVSHSAFEPLDFASARALGTLLFDVKGVLPAEEADARL
ncbi:MAG: nucleotide sugar dehydrogenase [Bacteroidales bacterium]